MIVFVENLEKQGGQKNVAIRSIQWAGKRFYWVEYDHTGEGWFLTKGETPLPVDEWVDAYTMAVGELPPKFMMDEVYNASYGQ